MLVGAASTAFLAKQMQPIIDDIFIARNPDMLLIVAMQVLFLFLFKGASHYGQSVTMTYVGEKIVADMRKQLIRHTLQADLSFFHNTSTGELISRFTTDVNMLHRIISRTITSLVKDGLTLIFLVGLMFYTDWKLAAYAFIAFPLAFYPIIRIGKNMRKKSNSIQEDYAQFTITLTQLFQGARLIKSYCMEKLETKETEKLITGLFDKIMKATKTRSMTHPIIEFLGGIAIVIVITYGGTQVISGEQTSGQFFAFITALLMSYEPLKSIANLNAELQEKLAGATRVFEILSVQPQIQDKPGAPDFQLKDGNIIFDNVHFSYTPEKKALNGIQLEITAGQKTALVGASGSGKSTMVNLIPRFYDVCAGHISIDGLDIRDVTTQSLRQHISLVSQEIMLFDDTIYGNIAYGKPDCTEQDVMAAAKAAAAHEFIKDLPNGYQTLVGENGVKLSGGQRQRIAIARAMLKNAPILLLDEATSALDNESEFQVQKALNRLMQGRTTLIVAHRLSTIIDADKIYVIDNGTVLSCGTHETLLTSCPSYANLYRGQDKASDELLSA
ncbi:MAG: ABC transporter ATP-binding protein [Alphaproteobacteria bacterium]|nr:ABC transporter ATP-binding protein [Alphaproteobacteria bacterium]